MIKFFFHLLLQLFHDFRQFLISVKTPAYSQMKANRMKALQKIIDIFCHKDIITVHILKKKQGLTAIKIQIEERTAKLFPDLKGNLITGRIKKASSDSIRIAQCHCSQTEKSTIPSASFRRS